MGPICRWWYVSVVPTSFPVFLLTTLLCSNRFLPHHISVILGSYAHPCLMLLLLFGMPPPLPLPALFFAWWTLILLSSLSKCYLLCESLCVPCWDWNSSAPSPLSSLCTSFILVSFALVPVCLGAVSSVSLCVSTQPKMRHRVGNLRTCTACNLQWVKTPGLLFLSPKAALALSYLAK